MAAVAGLSPCRACADFSDLEGERCFDVTFHVDTEHGAPTPEAWSSLALLTDAVQTMVIAGRQLELTINAAERSLFFTIEGNLADIEPDELAGWLKDFAEVV